MEKEDLGVRILERIEELCPSDDIADFFKGKPLYNLVIIHPPLKFYGDYAVKFQKMIQLFKDSGLDYPELVDFITRVGIKTAYEEIGKIGYEQ